MVVNNDIYSLCFRDLKPDNLLLDEKGLSRMRTFNAFITLVMVILVYAKLNDSVNVSGLRLTQRVKSFDFVNDRLAIVTYKQDV